MTSVFLRLKGDLERMSVLFRDLPKTGGGSSDTNTPAASESDTEAACPPLSTDPSSKIS